MSLHSYIGELLAVADLVPATEVLQVSTTLRQEGSLTYPHRTVWNRELLYVGGVLCRVVYEWELSKIQRSWEATQELQDRLQECFLHVLKFFTFHRSTPSSKIAELLSESFYGCSTVPLRLLSLVGIREAPDIRKFDRTIAKFLKSFPMLSEYVTEGGAHSIATLPDQHKISAITLSDVLQDLRCHPLDVEELVACLGWWITSGRDYPNYNMADLLGAITLHDSAGAICLSSITHFIDPQALGSHIPPDGPLPRSLIPLTIAKHFNRKDFSNFRWEEFTVATWLRYISCPDVMSADEEYDFTQSVGWASRVLSTISQLWPQLSEDVRNEAKTTFKRKPCIPTSHGLHCPEDSYLPPADNALFHRLNLPIVGYHPGFEVDQSMKSFLTFVGVRKNPPVQSILHQ